MEDRLYLATIYYEWHPLYGGDRELESHHIVFADSIEEAHEKASKHWNEVIKLKCEDYMFDSIEVTKAIL